MTRTRIEPQRAAAFEIRRGDRIKIIDPEGEQVADLFALDREDDGEWLSNGRTFDYNGTIYVTEGHTLYSNRSEPLLSIVGDTVGRHDFLFAPCSREMFRIQYGIEGPHPNCLANLAAALGVSESSITVPLNVFMNATVLPDGRIEIAPPRSRPGDSTVFRAEKDLRVAIAACSAGLCNNHRCGPIDVEIQRT